MPQDEKKIKNTPEGQKVTGLTVFIPLYNEAQILEKNVRVLLQYLDRLGLAFEVILGSNGSTDRTPRVGQRLEQTHARVTFFHIALRGPGLAFAEALKRATYSSFFCMDADLSFDMNFIRRAMEALGDYDAVVGSKQMATQKRPLIRILASEIFIACTKRLLQMPFCDYSIGAKAYRTDAIRPFIDRVDRHTFYTQELLYQLQRSGRKILEIPVNCEDRRKSKFNLIHEGFYRYGKLFELWVRSLKE